MKSDLAHSFGALIRYSYVMRQKLLTLLMCFVLPVTAGHAAMRAAELADTEAIIEYASHVDDFRHLTQVSELLVDESARGDLQKLVHYYSALAAYRAAEIDEDIEFRVGVLLDRCIDQGKAALKIDPEYADALALMGACHGLAASRQPLSAIVSGNFSARELKRALVLEPENPRVQLLQAVTLLRRYETGVRMQQARDALARSLQLYDEFVDLEQDGGPQWGREHAHLWMARLARKDEQPALARDHLEQALLIAPQFAEATRELRDLGG
ncbi:MAG: hypothetical protein AAAFM81_04325 [Pseudomonadota bacterium]